MSILIKGMEMPTNCEKCPFLDYEEGFCFASGVKDKSGWYESTLCPGGIKGDRHDDCPLVPVPPHGRLIDVGVLNEELWKIRRSCQLMDDTQTADKIMRGLYLAEQAIKKISTIIPAEEALQAIIDCPTADVRPVVLCRDCRWWTKEEKSLQGRNTGMNICQLGGFYPTGEWFCANGERPNCGAQMKEATE